VSATRPGLVRALGAVAALGWVSLALYQPAGWPRAGFMALGISLAVALLLRPVAKHVPRVLLAPPRVAFVGVCAIAAAGISWWVLRHAMRDQPLSIDAGIYLLQARAIAHGHFGIAAPHPVQAFGDRFLVEGPDGLLYGIFPPGWPLAIAPFVVLGVPTLSGPVIAVALVVAQATLGRAVGRAAGDEDGGELATRVSILISLASIGRALETADLLSHAFVAVLAAFAMAGALDLAGGATTPRRAVVVGLCVGWVLASRLLDGLVLAAAVAGVLAWRRPGARALFWMGAGATPLLLLLALEQHAATGSWLTPTQTQYFLRSDWPPTCHRLGFGADVGCTVEHPGPVSRLGGDGYQLLEGLGVTRERAGSLGEDLLGWPPLMLLAFVPLVVGASAVDGVAVALVFALTLAYGLFYYGNAMFFGARHLFPVAAFVWLLVARGAVCTRLGALRGAGVLVLLAVAVWGVREPWKTRTAGAADFQQARSDLRRTMELEGIDRGILKTHDLTSFASSFDPWRDDGRRIMALDDSSALVELRRAHPDLPLFLSLPDDRVGRMYVTRPPPGILVELERSWPTFVRPSGLGSKQDTQTGASGGSVLLLSHASPGASLSIPFETAVAGEYAVRVDAVTGPSQGDYALELDGAALPDWHGYAAEVGVVHGPAVRRSMDATRHVLVARCIGRDPASSGYDARLDALVGEP